MNNFGRKIGLIQCFETTLTISEEEFIRRFKFQFGKTQSNLITRAFGFLHSKNKPLYGEIKDRKLILTQNIIGVNNRIGKVTASGGYVINGDQIAIRGDVSSYNWQSKLMLISTAILYAMLLIASALTAISSQKSDFPVQIVLPFVLLHGVFMYGMFYRFSIKVVKAMKNNVIKELYSLTISDLSNPNLLEHPLNMD